jgi:hypothetical protein
MRTAVDLDEAALVDATSGHLLLSTMYHRVPPYPACLQVDIAPGFQVRGWGPRRLGVRNDYVTTLATAVVRAWESEQLAAEHQHTARISEVNRATPGLRLEGIASTTNDSVG